MRKKFSFFRQKSICDSLSESRAKDKIMLFMNIDNQTIKRTPIGFAMMHFPLCE